MTTVGGRPPLLLGYATPAGHFKQVLPVGNGRLGAMVFGATHRERLVLNLGGPGEETDQPGEPGCARRHPSAALRRPLRRGRNALPRAVPRHAVDDRFVPADGRARPPRRLARGRHRLPPLAGPRRRRRGHRVARARDRPSPRTIFASASDQVLVIRHEIVKGRPVPIAARLTREGPIARSASVDGDLLLTGFASDAASQYGSGLPGAPPSGAGLPIAIRLRAIVDGGRQDLLDDRLRIDGTRAATFLIAMAAAFREADPSDACRRMLDAAAARSYDDLLVRHQADHRALFRSFDLDLAARADDGRTVGTRLVALAAQHRRDLLIAASRPGSLPSTLQGIWTEQQQQGS